MGKVASSRNAITLLVVCFSAFFAHSGKLIDQSLNLRFSLLFALLFVFYLSNFNSLKAIKITAFSGIVILFSAWSISSIIWSQNLSEALSELRFLFLGIGVFHFVLMAAKSSENYRNNFVFSIVLSSGFLLLLAFFQVVVQKHYNPYLVPSLSFNNNIFSGFLFLSFPFCVETYYRNKGVRRNIGLGVGIFVVFFCTILFTRAIYIAFLCFGALILSHLFVRKRIAGRMPDLSMFKRLSTGSLLLITLFYCLQDDIRKQYFLNKLNVFQYYTAFTADNSKDHFDEKSSAYKDTSASFYSEQFHESARLRLIFWKKSIELVKKTPVLGCGIGNWKVVVPSVAKYDNPNHMLKNRTYNYPHNEFIGITAELGLPGLILFLFLLVPIPIWSLVKSWGKANSLHLIYSASAISFFLFASFDFPFKRPETIFLFASTLALLYRRDCHSLFEKYMYCNNKHFSAFPVGLLIISMFFLLVSVKRSYGELNTKKVFKYEYKNDSAVIEYSNKAKSAFYTIAPNNLPVDWFKGVAYARTGKYKEALDCFQDAIKETPFEGRVLNDLGSVCFYLKKFDQAKFYFREGIKLDSYFDDPKFNLAALYLELNNLDSARHYVQLCRESPKKRMYLGELDSLKVIRENAIKTN